MEKRTIYLTEFDYDRLTALIDQANPHGLNKSHLKALKEELERGEIVPPTDIPRDVVTMNSQVRLKDLDSGEEVVYSLVFPYAANIQQNKISILAPVGIALIGYRIGDVVEWNVPAGVRRLKIEDILYQPEAAGDYHL